MQEEQQEHLIKGISLPRLNQEVLIQEVDDFRQPLEKMLELHGLSQNFKRNAKRKFAKELTTVSGQVVSAEDNQYSGDKASSKQILPDKFGYGIFDVVEPQYNLHALSKIYEVSAANYAAINAKVANIVGLGYDLKPTLKVTQRMEESPNPEDLAKYRKNISNAKARMIDWLESRNDEDTLTATLGTGTPAARQRAMARQDSRSTHCPMRRIMPSSSARSINRAGPITPSKG